MLGIVDAFKWRMEKRLRTRLMSWCQSFLLHSKVLIFPLQEEFEIVETHPQNLRTVYASPSFPNKAGQSSGSDILVPTNTALKKECIIRKPQYVIPTNWNTDTVRQVQLASRSSSGWPLTK